MNGRWWWYDFGEDMCQGLIHVPVLELLSHLALKHRRVEQNGLGLREDCLCAIQGNGGQSLQS